MRKFYLKTLFLACTMLMSVSSVWGVTYNTTVTGIVGATDNTSGFNIVGSKQMSLAAGDEYVITFVNYNKGAEGTNYWANWAFISNVFNCRADHGESNPYWGSATNVNYTGSSWTDISSTINEWLQAYNGVTVTLTVSRNAAGTGITVSHEATTNAVASIASQTYSGTFTATVGAETAINFYLTVENAHLNITKVIHTDASGNSTHSYNASESAYVDSSNGTTNYNGSSVSQLQINNTQYRNWSSGSDGSVKFNTGGKAALYKFDLSEIKSLSNITTISFTVVGISSDTKATTPVWLLGYNPEWSASTITYNSGFTNNGDKETLTGTVSGKGSFQPLDDTGTYTVNGNGSGYTTMSANAKTYVESAITADKDYVSFGLAVNLGRVAYLNVGADLTISCSASVVYTATFTETNSLSPTVTIYSDAGRSETVSNGALTDGTTYYYRAVLEGYHDFLGSFTVDGADPVVEFAMTAKTVYNFSVNAIDGGSGVIKSSIVSGTCYADETTHFYLPECVLVDGTLYFRTYEDSYKSETVTSNNQVFSYPYTTASVDNVVFFVEGESISGASTSTATNNQRLASNGYMGRGENLSVTTLPAGEYTIYVHYINTNSGPHSVVVKAGETDVINNTSLYGRSTINGSITLPESKAISLTAAASSTSGVDYLYIQKTGEYTIEKTSTSNLQGFKTFYHADLNFEVDDYTTIYKASSPSENVIRLTEVEGKIIPKGTPVILKTTNTSDYKLTLTCTSSTASSDYFTGNILEAANGGESNVYILAYSSSKGGLGFYKYTSPLVAGDVYLNIPATTKSRLEIVIDDEVTGIGNIAVENISNGALFNVAGQRVDANYKGVIIKNGKKYYNK